MTEAYRLKPDHICEVGYNPGKDKFECYTLKGKLVTLSGDLLSTMRMMRENHDKTKTKLP